MPFSPKDALEAVRHILGSQYAAERPRLDMLHEAMRPDNVEAASSVEIPNDAPPMMRKIARKSQTNYMPLVVDTFGQVMKVDGYYTKSSDPSIALSDQTASPWQIWQRNRMDARQTGLHRSCLQYGTGYALVFPGMVRYSDQTTPNIRLFTPRRLTALYQDEETDEWPIMAMYFDKLHLCLVDETHEYRFGVKTNQPIWKMDPQSIGMMPNGALEYIESREHGTGFCPVVRYRDRQLLDGEEQLGVIEPLLTIQSRIHETTFGMMVAQYLAAFKQRYVLGWMPESEKEELKAGASRIWYLDVDPAEVNIGELSETDLTRYIQSKDSAIRDMAAIGQLPATALGVDGVGNVSPDALAGLEAAKDRKTGEITTSLGESHEQMLRLCAKISGDVESASDFEAECRWKEMTARSYAQTVDGLVKLATGLGMPPEIALEDVPGMTDSRLRRIISKIEQNKQEWQAQYGDTGMQSPYQPSNPGVVNTMPDAPTISAPMIGQQ